MTKTTKITAVNSFHATTITTRIKKVYADDADPMIALEISASQDQDKYAIRTISRINKALCPHGQRGCACTSAIKI